MDRSFPSHISPLMPPAATVLGPDSGHCALTRKRDKVGGSPTWWQQAVKQPMRGLELPPGLQTPGTGSSPSVDTVLFRGWRASLASHILSSQLIPICKVSFVRPLLEWKEQEDLKDLVSLIYRKDTGLARAKHKLH